MSVRMTTCTATDTHMSSCELDKDHHHYLPDRVARVVEPSFDEDADSSSDHGDKGRRLQGLKRESIKHEGHQNRSLSDHFIDATTLRDDIDVPKCTPDRPEPRPRPFSRSRSMESASRRPVPQGDFAPPHPDRYNFPLPYQHPNDPTLMPPPHSSHRRRPDERGHHRHSNSNGGYSSHNRSWDEGNGYHHSFDNMCPVPYPHPSPYVGNNNGPYNGPEPYDPYFNPNYARHPPSHSMPPQAGGPVVSAGKDYPPSNKQYSGQKHRRVFSGEEGRPPVLHRRINSSGNSAVIERNVQPPYPQDTQQQHQQQPTHHRENSAGLDILTAAANVSKEELAAAAGVCSTDPPPPPPPPPGREKRRGNDYYSCFRPPPPREIHHRDNSLFAGESFDYPIPYSGSSRAMHDISPPVNNGRGHPSQQHPMDVDYPNHYGNNHPPLNNPWGVPPPNPNYSNQYYPSEQPGHHRRESSNPHPQYIIPDGNAQRHPPTTHGDFQPPGGGIDPFSGNCMGPPTRQPLNPEHRYKHKNQQPPPPPEAVVPRNSSFSGSSSSSSHHRNLSSLSFGSTTMPLGVKRNDTSHQRFESTNSNFFMGFGEDQPLPENFQPPPSGSRHRRRETAEIRPSIDAIKENRAGAYYNSSNPPQSTSPQGENIRGRENIEHNSPNEKTQTDASGNVIRFSLTPRSAATAKRVRRKCSVIDCDNRVVQGGLCISHGAKRKQCAYEGCTKNVKKAGLCSTHGPARKRCEYDGCFKVAVQGGKCIAHGAKKKLCIFQGCKKQAIVTGMCKKHHDEKKGITPAMKRKNKKGTARSCLKSDQTNNGQQPATCVMIENPSPTRETTGTPSGENQTERSSKPGHRRGLSIFTDMNAVETIIGDESLARDAISSTPPDATVPLDSSSGEQAQQQPRQQQPPYEKTKERDNAQHRRGLSIFSDVNMADTIIKNNIIIQEL